MTPWLRGRAGRWSMPTRTDRRRWIGQATLLAVACLSWLSAGCGRVSTADLIAATRSNNSSDRARAVQALGARSRDAGIVVPVLVERLKDEDAFVRRDAAQALGR